MSVIKTYNFWKKEFEKLGIKPELIEAYLAYIKPLLRNHVPIIFDFNHLCLLLGKNKKYLDTQDKQGPVKDIALITLKQVGDI